MKYNKVDIMKELIIKKNNEEITLVDKNEIIKALSEKPDENEIPDVSDKESITNKTTTLSSSSTDTQYPSAKCVYDAIESGGSGGINIQLINSKDNIQSDGIYLYIESSEDTES